MRKKAKIGVSVAVAFCLLALPVGTASASEKTVVVPTPDAACPPTGRGAGDDCNKVYVRQFGVAAKSKKVLILIPGFQGGAGDFTLIARDLVKRVPGLQVWAIDRRSQVLEDTSKFVETLSKAKKSLAIRRTALESMFDYYLGSGLGAPGVGIEPRDQQDDGPWAKTWGAAMTLNDIHSVVALAIDQGLTPAIGGHSLGGSLATLYSAWDFDDGPGGLPDGAGHDFIHGIVLIDGGGKSTTPSTTTAQNVACLLEAAQPGDISCGTDDGFERTQYKLEDTPWALLLEDAPLAEAAGLFAEVGAVYAKLDPRGSAERLLNYGLLPDELKPAKAKFVTNRALLGNAFDRDSSPSALGLLHVNAGRIATKCGSTEAKLCDWKDGGVTNISRVIAAFGQESSGTRAEANGSEWYFSRRLSLDVGVGGYLQQTESSDGEAADALGLRLFDGATIDDPLFVIQTDLTAANQSANLLSRTDALVAYSDIAPGDYVKIDASTGKNSQSHLDPLLAVPGKNRFLGPVVSFLKKKAFK